MLFLAFIEYTYLCRMIMTCAKYYLPSLIFFYICIRLQNGAYHFLKFWIVPYNQFFIIREQRNVKSQGVLGDCVAKCRKMSHFVGKCRKMSQFFPLSDCFSLFNFPKILILFPIFSLSFCRLFF